MQNWKKLVLASSLVLGFVALAQEAEFVESVGAFDYYENLDPFTDSDNSFIGTFDSTDEEILYFRCVEGELESFVTSGYLGSDGTAPVEFRFDKKTPSDTHRWNLSTDGTAVFVPYNSMTTWVEEAKTSSTLVIRMTDYDYSTETYSFDLSGLSEALTRLSCAEQI